MIVGGDNSAAEREANERKRCEKHTPQKHTATSNCTTHTHTHRPPPNTHHPPPSMQHATQSITPAQHIQTHRDSSAWMHACRVLSSRCDLTTPPNDMPIAHRQNASASSSRLGFTPLPLEGSTAEEGMRLSTLRCDRRNANASCKWRGTFEWRLVEPVSAPALVLSRLA